MHEPERVQREGVSSFFVGKNDAVCSAGRLSLLRYLGLNEKHDPSAVLCCCCRVLWARRAICALPSITLSTDIRAQLARERALDARKIFQLQGLFVGSEQHKRTTVGTKISRMKGLPGL